MGPGNEQVSITYTTSMSESDVKRDLEKLAVAGNWAITNGRVSTQADATPGSKPTTSATFNTQGIVDLNQGAFHIEPFLVALKRFDPIELIYLNIPQMEFHGLKDFENEFVKIKMSSEGSSYRYRINIKDDGFDKLNLPFVIVKQQAQQEETSSWPRTAAVIGIALLAGAVAYFIALQLSKSRKVTGG